MDASAVAAFDVAEQVASELVSGGPTMLVDELNLEGVEEALHGCMLVAVADAAHGRHGADRGELLDAGLGGKVVAAV